MSSSEVYHERSGLLSLLLASAFCGQQDKRVPSTREFFYVGGKYSGDVMSGQMYGEALRPRARHANVSAARGRSAWHSRTNGALTIITLPDEENRFTAPKVGGLWPQAKLHTHWPSDFR
jgi:hypothetical protein